MIKVYLPIGKDKKSDIRGFWPGDNGLCYDYIDIVKAGQGDIAGIQKRYNQEAIFYTTGKGLTLRAFIYHNPKITIKLKSRTLFTYPKGKRGLKGYIKSIISIYGGLTVYIKDNHYLLEIWR